MKGPQQRMSLGWVYRSACALFVLVAPGAYVVAAMPDGRRGTSGIVLHVLLTGLMLAAWWGACNDPGKRHRLALIAGMGAILIVAPISVSRVHDVQRYLWDGAVLAAHRDPYRLAPIAPEVVDLRAFWPTPSEHEAYPTIYPPGALFLFALAAVTGPDWAPVLWKLVVVAAALGTLWLGTRALEGLGLSRHTPLLALSPLLLMEAATGAHLDVVAALALAAGLCATVHGHWARAGIAFGAGALLKFLPALAAAPIAMWLTAPRSRRLALGCAAAVAVGYTAALLLGLHPLGSLPLFFMRWRFGSPLFSSLEAIAGSSCAQVLAPGVAIVAFIVALRRPRERWKSSVSLAMAAPLLASPVVFPWYVAPLVPVVAMAPSGFMLGWLSAMPLTLEVVDGFATAGIWQPAAWPLWAIATAWAVGLAFDLTPRARHARGLTTNDFFAEIRGIICRAQRLLRPGKGNSQARQNEVP